MISTLLFTLLVTGQAAPAAPLASAGSTNQAAPLNEEQLAKLRELVRTTQTTAERLRQELAERERALAECYAQFQLDEATAEKLQAEVVERQRQLLANYHHLQVELRKIVGPERFGQLKLRLDNALRNNALRPKPKAEEPVRAAPTGAPAKSNASKSGSANSDRDRPTPQPKP